MKKMFIAIACVLFAGGVYAQNSAVESDIKLTEIEGFINSCNYSKYEEMSKYSDNGLEIFPFVYTDLITGKKMGGVKLMTESKMAKAAFMAAMTGQSADDGRPMNLGYLDVNEIKDFIKALENIQVESKAKTEYNFTITYSTPAGISIIYDKDKNEFFVSKKWYSINAFGTREASYVITEGTAPSKIKEIVKALNDGLSRINESLNK